MSTGGTLRDRTRERMRDEVAMIAIALFLERGFETVTTGDIATAAGISPRSFFRYFETKEDVVLSRLRDAAEPVRIALSSRPQNESVWESLRIAFHRLVEKPVFVDADAFQITRLIVTSSSIQARSTQKRQDWENALLPEVIARLPSLDSVPGVADVDRARALIAAGLACVDAATKAWLASEGTADPVQLVDAIMGQLRAVD